MSSDGRDRDFQRSTAEGSGRYFVQLDGGRSNLAKLVPKTEDPAGDRGKIVFRDPRSRHVRDLAEKVAATSSTVLLSGETGVGKEIYARFIHYRSDRRGGPFVDVNCAALSASLLESELFGHEKGAFSGAIRQHIGVFERAHGGTILLDEVSEMPIELQAKLLRVIQERRVTRVGGSASKPVDIRIIATTNRSLKAYVEEGHFREDLYYRLNVFPIVIPALRDRAEDIEPLARYYVARLAKLMARDAPGMSPAALEMLSAYAFPGNIRELINILERALILAGADQEIGVEHLIMEDSAPVESSEEDEYLVSFRAGDDELTDIRKKIIERTLARYGGNRTRTAERLGVSERTIRNKLRDYDEDESD